MKFSDRWGTRLRGAFSKEPKRTFMLRKELYFVTNGMSKGKERLSCFCRKCEKALGFMIKTSFSILLLPAVRYQYSLQADRSAGRRARTTGQWKEYHQNLAQKKQKDGRSTNENVNNNTLVIFSTRKTYPKCSVSFDIGLCLMKAVPICTASAVPPPKARRRQLKGSSGKTAFTRRLNFEGFFEHPIVLYRATGCMTPGIRSPVLLSNADQPEEKSYR